MTRCTFGFHKWGKWVQTQAKMKQWQSPLLGGSYMGEGYVTVQMRTCLLCNKAQEERVS